MHNCIDGLKFYGSLDLPPPPFMVNADVWSPFWNNGPCTVETMTWQLLLAIAIQFHQRKITLRSPFLHLTMELEIKLPTKCQLRPSSSNAMCQANISKITSPMHRL